MIDVSAQASCTITPISPTTLTAAGGVLPNGTENVMIRCTCSEDDGSVITTVRWHNPDGSIVPRIRANNFIDGTPHYTRASGDRDNRNITLVISTFSDSNVGTYTCGRRNGNNPPLPPTATVSLIINGELFFLKSLLCRCMCVSVCPPPRLCMTSGMIWYDMDCV